MHAHVLRYDFNEYIDMYIRILDGSAQSDITDSLRRIGNAVCIQFAWISLNPSTVEDIGSKHPRDGAWLLLCSFLSDEDKRFLPLSAIHAYTNSVYSTFAVVFFLYNRTMATVALKTHRNQSKRDSFINVVFPKWWIVIECFLWLIVRYREMWKRKKNNNNGRFLQ